MKALLVMVFAAMVAAPGLALADKLPPPPADAPPKADTPPPKAETPPPAPAPTPMSIGEAHTLRKVCTDALNANPSLAKDLIDSLDKEAGKRRDEQDAQAKEQSAKQIALDERQVILAYAAMWVVAAVFVLYLWMKQRGLKDEIARLRRDLEAAGQK